jgi:prepilin peptidase CpaA
MTLDRIIAVLSFLVLTEVVRQDVLYRRIPNWTSLTIAGLGLARWLLRGDLTAAAWACVAAFCVLTGTAFLTWRNMMGGGDAKLLPALTLLVSGHDTMKNSSDLIIWTALIGGVVSLAVLAWSRVNPRAIKPEVDGESTREEPVTVPYGVAIAAAGVWVLTSQVIDF